MRQECSQCLFCEAVEDENFMACQATQKLVMPGGKVCDFFEPKGCVCEECTMTMELNGVNEYTNDIQDEYTNTTALGKDECCNANSYPKHWGEDYEPCDCDECTEPDYDNWSQADFLGDDLDSATAEVLENLAFLGEGTTPRDVLSSILGLEATVSLLKRFLLEYEDTCTQK